MTIPKFNAFVFAFVLAAGLVGTVTTSDAATYYVAPNGNDGAAGTNLATAWLTIGAATTVATNSGDIVYVNPGFYPERVSIRYGGKNGVYINYVGVGQPACFGFDISSCNYIRVIGFEMYQTKLTSNTRGIALNNTCMHIDILDNYIHNFPYNGILATASSTTSYITVRGNTVNFTGIIPNVWSNSSVVAIGNNIVTSDHWLIEYNTVWRSGDFIDIFGTNNIVRNNYLHDYADAYYTNALNSEHADFFQMGSDGMQAGSRYHIYENNFCADNIEENSHFGIVQDSGASTQGTPYGDTNLMFRGDIAINIGSGFLGVKTTPKVVMYNCTAYSVANSSNSPAGDGTAVVFYQYGTAYTRNGMCVNTILDSVTNASSGSPPIYGQSGGSTATLANDLGIQCGADTATVLHINQQNPLFIDPTGARDFHIQTGSPAKGTGVNIVWITSSSGSGTTFNVNDGLLLCDGLTMTTGDIITTGGTTTYITAISGNACDGGKLGGLDDQSAGLLGEIRGEPILGALPYGSRALTSARSFIRAGNNYSVGTTGDARGGVGFMWMAFRRLGFHQEPFTATITNGIVTAKAYALYAPDESGRGCSQHARSAILPLPPTALSVLTNAP